MARICLTRILTMSTNFCVIKFYLMNSYSNKKIFVPALSWLYSSFDTSIGHFRRYHKKNLVNLVSELGFKIERCHYFDSLGILPWFIVMKMLKRSLNPKSVKWYDSIIIPWLKLVERFFIPPIGKNLLLVASKR